MKVRKEEATANRKRIFDVASRLFRERRFDGIGLADLMKGAGMARCGFYCHFKSKDHSAAEACDRVMVPPPNGRRSQESQVAMRSSPS
jgi:TetR/AcrR family transcriptional repressor of nem operon